MPSKSQRFAPRFWAGTALVTILASAASVTPLMAQTIIGTTTGGNGLAGGDADPIGSLNGKGGTGGTGGVSGSGGAGGTGGPGQQVNGTAGNNGTSGGGGGGAGGGRVYGGTAPLSVPGGSSTEYDAANGGAGTVAIQSPTTGQGGSSGQGGWTGQANQNGRGVGGGGGGGGAGIFVNDTGGGSYSVIGPITGGNGGAGGEGGYGGGGGGGGNGAQLTGGTYTLQSSIAGGNGGNGGVGDSGTIESFGGSGGGGGSGVVLTNGTLTISAGASVTGGNGGAGGTSLLAPGRPGQGAAGIIASGANVILAGSVTGGVSGGATGTRTNAITFVPGTNNRLELWSTGAVTGIVSASGGVNTFALGGAGNGTFDVSNIGPAAQYQGFTNYEKTGSSTWVLTGTTTATTAWTLSGGTFSVAEDGNLGAQAGTLTIQNNARLLTRADFTSSRAIILGAGGGTVDTQAQRATLNGVISGAGGLTKTGSGTLALTGAPTYSGATTISEGTLEFRGSTSGLTGGMLNNSRVVFDQSAASSFSGSMIGIGSLVKRGGSNLTLSGPMAYTGTTDIEAGTLTYGGDVIGLAGLIRNNAALAFNNNADTSLLTDVTGPGSLTKLGNGTLTLLGNYTYTGGTFANGGILQLGNAGRMTSVQGAINIGSTGEVDVVNANVGAISSITNNGVLTFNGASTAGSLPILNRSFLFFFDNSSAANARIDNRNTLEFADFSSGGSATLINRSGASIQFQDNSTPDNATINNNGVIDFSPTRGPANNNRISAGSIAGSGQFYLGLNQLTVGGNQRSTTVSGSIRDSGSFGSRGGSLVKVGSGTLTLSGTNTYSGGTTISGGTVAITSDASLGATSGTVTLDGAELQFNNSFSLSANRGMVLSPNGGTVDVQNNDAVIAGIISGNGSLIKDGAGALTLTGANTYSGSTLLTEGTLSVAGSGSIANSSVAMSSGTTFDISDASGNVAVEALTSSSSNTAVTLGGNSLVLSGTPGNTLYAGAISGSGGLVKQGTNTATFSGNPAYTGQTTVSGGTLQFTGNVAGLTGPIVTNANLGIASSLNNTLSGNISGNGTLTQSGPGTLTLTGSNTYSGGTNINGGTLIGSVANLGTGPIDNDGALLITQPTNAVFAAPINGTGTLTKIGAGLLELTGTGTLSGPTLVQQGELKVNGSLAASPVTLSSGTLISGTGTIGGLEVQGGAQVAPGNTSIGTLRVTGNVLFHPGSLYDLDLDAADVSDRIEGSGRAELRGGTVAIYPDRGRYSLRPYTILTAAQGVRGRFEKTGGEEFAFLTPVLDYYPDRVTLTLVRKTNPPGPEPKRLSSEAVSANEFATAEGIENLGEGNTLFDTVIGTSVSGARQAFDALSGEIHASAATSVYADNSLIERTILNRLRTPLAESTKTIPDPLAAPVFDPQRFTLWGQALGAWSRTRSNGNAASMDWSTGGFMVGAEANLDNAYRVGLAGGFTHTSFDVDARLSSGSNESIFGVAYGSAAWGAVNLRLGAAYSGHDVDTNRTILFPGFVDLAAASYNAYTAQAFGEVGYKMAFGSVMIQPFAGISALRLHTEAFRETGGEAALTGYARDHDLLTTTLGVQASMQVSSDIPLTLNGLIGWRHAYGHVAPTSHLAFADGLSSFTISGVPIDRNALVAEAGLDWAVTQAFHVGFDYSGQVSLDTQSHAFKGNLNWRF